jgi:TonB family protein
MKRFAGLLLSLSTASAFSQSDTPASLTLAAASEAASATPQFIPGNAIPCQYGFPAGTPRQTTPNGPAAVHVSLNEQGQVKSVELWESSGDVAFDSLALRQSKLAICKPFIGSSGKSIPVETAFIFPGTPADLPAKNSAMRPFAQSVQRLVHANFRWRDGIVDLPVVISMYCSPDGKVLSATIDQSSGDVALDAAVLKAIRDSGPMPADYTGKTPTHFTITYYQKR